MSTELTPLTRTIGPRIKQHRKAAGMNQTQLAAKCGCYQKDVSRWESGERVPTVEALYRLSKALGARMEDFIEE